jgi:Ulp1 family protease
LLILSSEHLDGVFAKKGSLPCQDLDIELLAKRRAHSDKEEDAGLSNASGSKRARQETASDNEQRKSAKLSMQNSGPRSITSAMQRAHLQPAITYETQRTTRSSVRNNQPDGFHLSQRGRSPSPVRWTGTNKEWQKRWLGTGPLSYPHDSKKKAVVDMIDIERLDEGEWLNDNLISFYLRYLEENLEKQNPEIARRVYINNTFFYQTLTQGVRKGINYDAVKRWTAKIDLFQYDYIIVPVHESAHWYLAIICNAPKYLKSLPEELPKDSSSPITRAKKAAAELEGNLNSKKSPSPECQPASHSTTDIGGETDACSNELGKLTIKTNGAESGNDDSRHAAAPKTITQNNSLADQNGCSTQSSKLSESGEKPITTPKGQLGRSSSKRKSTPSARRYDPRDPRIMTLDSFGQGHSATCVNLRDYIRAEALDKKDVSLPPTPMGMTAKWLPEQSNFCDCGIFVLGYAQKFLQDPDTFVGDILQGKKESEMDWSDLNPTKMRNEMRELIFTLRSEQEQRKKEEKAARKAAKLFKSNQGLTEQPKVHDEIVNISEATVAQQSPIPSSPPKGEGTGDIPELCENQSEVHDVDDSVSELGPQPVEEFDSGDDSSAEEDGNHTSRHSQSPSTTAASRRLRILEQISSPRLERLPGSGASKGPLEGTNLPKNSVEIGETPSPNSQDTTAQRQHGNANRSGVPLALERDRRSSSSERSSQQELFPKKKVLGRTAGVLTKATKNFQCPGSSQQIPLDLDHSQSDDVVEETHASQRAGQHTNKSEEQRATEGALAKRSYTIDGRVAYSDEGRVTSGRQFIEINTTSPTKAGSPSLTSKRHTDHRVYSSPRQQQEVRGKAPSTTRHQHHLRTRTPSPPPSRLPAKSSSLTSPRRSARKGPTIVLD